MHCNTTQAIKAELGQENDG